MRYKKAFLIQPFYKERHYHFAYLPVGMGYIAEYLKENGIEYDFLDMNMDLGARYSFSYLTRRIKEFGPDLIAVGMFTYRHRDAFALIGKLKRVFANVKIAAGGPHVSTMERRVLEDCKYIDYGITLEGEETLLELCGNKELRDIKGLIYRETDEIIYTGPREFIQDIDRLPFPKYDRFYMKGYPRTMTILTSRGCPHDCIFCSAKVTIGRKLRARSAENVIREIAYWRERGWKEFGIVDDNFTFNRKRVLDICDAIESRGMKDIKLTCGNGIRADRIDRELLRRMKDVGFYQLSIGVEAGNNKVLKNIKKGENIETLEEAIRVSCETGFDVRLFFLLGSPGETEADIEDSIKLALRYPVATARFYNIVPFPKTELFEWIKKRNLFLRKPEEYLNNAALWDLDKPVFETPELPKSDRIRLAKKADRLRRRIREKDYLRRLGSEGIFFRMLAYLYMTDFLQRGLLRLEFSRKVSAFLKKLFFNIRVKESRNAL